jgi:hypothetical protein
MVFIQAAIDIARMIQISFGMNQVIPINLDDKNQNGLQLSGFTIYFSINNSLCQNFTEPKRAKNRIFYVIINS